METNHEQLARNRVFNLVDNFEDRIGKMIHETHLAEKMEQWQSGKLKSSFFIETLNKEFDKLNK